MFFCLIEVLSPGRCTHADSINKRDASLRGHDGLFGISLEAPAIIRPAKPAPETVLRYSRIL